MTPLGDGDFALLRDYLRGTAGLEFDASRRSSVSAAVAERLRTSGCPDVAAYLRLLDRPDGAAERQHLLDDVTIQETHFHRARPQIDALRDHLLPSALRVAAREGRGITVWSAGCSTGEEAYTLAMLALEAREQLLGIARLSAAPPIRVVGTDVSTAALDLARRARYSGRTVSLAEPGAVSRWLSPDGAGDHVVRDEVRDLVEFAHHNLVTEPPPFADGAVDLVVCRNVTIYFSRETTRALVGRFQRSLHVSGWLLLGPAETLWQLSDDFALAAVGEAFAYQPLHSAPLTRSAAPPVPEPVRRGRPRLLTPRRELVRPPGRARVAEVAQERPLGTSGKDLLAKATVAFDAGRYSDAAELAARACQADPLLTEAYVVAGRAEATLGRDAEALGPLGRAVYLDARAGHAWFLLAGSLGRTGDRAGAARAYRAAADALPTAPAAAVHGLLDGAPVEQLVQLCHRLADDLEGRSDLRRGA